MSTSNLSLVTCNTQSDTKEIAASTKKLNTWSTPLIFNNSCMKNIIDFCNDKQLLRLLGVNRYCNQVISNKYPNLSFHLCTLNSLFTKCGSFLPPSDNRNHDEHIAWMNNLKQEVIFRNGDLRLLKYNVWTTIGEDQNVLIKKGERTIKVEDRDTGKCLVELFPINMDARMIISAFKISQNEYTTVSSDGKIVKYDVKSYLKNLVCYSVASSIFNFSDIYVSKALKIGNKIYLLAKRITEHNLILLCYDLDKKKPSTFCQGSTYSNFNTFVPIIDCIANKTHLFVIFQFGVACYDNQQTLIWQQNDLLNTTNENATLELNNKFLLITSYQKNFYGTHRHVFYKVYHIADGTRRDLKCKTHEFELKHPDETFNFWEDYIISQRSFGAAVDIELWNPNTGRLITRIFKQFIFNGHILWPLKNNGGLLGLSTFGCGRQKQTLFQKLFHPSEVPDTVINYEFFLLKAPAIPNKRNEKRALKCLD